MEHPVFLNTFNFDSEKKNHNRACEIIGVYINPNETDKIDFCNMPQIAIRFLDNGEEYSALTEEINAEFWPQSIHDFFAGRRAFMNKTTDCSLTEDRKKAWEFGYQHAEIYSSEW